MKHPDLSHAANIVAICSSLVDYDNEGHIYIGASAIKKVERYLQQEYITKHPPITSEDTE